MRVLWLGPLLLLLEISLRPVSEPDVFFYLALINNYRMTGLWPVEDPFLSTAGEGLHSLHQWLGYWIFYGSYQVLGWVGPQLIKTVALLLIFVMPIAALHFGSKGRRATHLPTVFPYLWAATVFSTHHRFRERAGLFGDLCVSALVGGLLFFKDRMWFWRALPLLFLFWAQVHPSFPLGFVILLLFAAFEWRMVLENRLWPWILAALIAPVLNPLGWQGFLYPFQFAADIEPYLRRHVMEWLPIYDPRVRPFLFVFIPFVTLFPYLIFQFSRIPWRLMRFELALTILLFLLMINSVRFGLTGQVLLLFIICRLSLFIDPLALENRRVWISVPIGILAILFLKIGHSPHLHRPFMERFGLDQKDMPVAASQKLKEMKPRMKIFNSFKYGGYLAWTWMGDPKIFFHGFSTNFDFYEKNYLDPQESDQALGSLIEREDIGIFLLSKTSNDRDFITLLAGRADWQLVYQDDEATIFAKRDPRVFGGAQ